MCKQGLDSTTGNNPEYGEPATVAGMLGNPPSSAEDPGQKSMVVPGGRGHLWQQQQWSGALLGNRADDAIGVAQKISSTARPQYLPVASTDSNLQRSPDQ